MAKRMKYEKETIVLFNEGEDTASIYTFNAGLRKRPATFSQNIQTFADWNNPMSRTAFPLCAG